MKKQPCAAFSFLFFEESWMNRRILLKAAFCLGGIILLIYIAITYHYHKIQQAQAPYITMEVVLREWKAISEVQKMDEFHKLRLQIDTKTEYLSYRDFKTIMKFYPVEELSFQKKYKKDRWKVSEKDWNEYLRKVIASIKDERIQIQELLYIGDANIVSEEFPISGNGLEEGEVFTDNGILKDTFHILPDSYMTSLEVLRLDQIIIAVLQKGDDESELKNCYIVDDTEKNATVFKDGYYILIASLLEDKVMENLQEEIADLIIRKGMIREMERKEEYISGKLLRVSDEEIEIEGHGIYAFQDEVAFYQLYDELRSLKRNQLPIGYEFTDFVIDEGKIAACLIMREEYMEYIRVLLRNSHYEEKHHKELVLSCDEDMQMISYLNGVEEQTMDISAGEKVSIDEKSFYEGTSPESKKRVKFVPSVLSGKITIHSNERNYGTPKYSGTLELTHSEDGFIVVNELLLEDYLTRVVPSEMPSYYPMEALKAQAVCARTYAYGKMLKSGLPAYGAHVDDSAAFQVYNNILPQGTTTQAVKDSYHCVLTYNQIPIETYYYSTSAGCGSGTSIWHGNGEAPAYLIPREIGTEPSENLAEQLTDEETFSNYIRSVNKTHYESEEGWYRWELENELEDLDALHTILRKRYELYPKLILVENENGEFVSQEIPDLGELKDIQITKRLSGGIVDELLLVGTEATVKVISELNVRHILANGTSNIQRQSGDQLSLTMLPSAYISLDVEKEEDIVTSYKIYGGGFGHGVGMSQNGAKNMAKSGMNYQQILQFFYGTSDLLKLNKEG